MHYYFAPPYFLLAVGLFISLTSGTAFQAILKQSVQEWSRNRSTRTLATFQGMQLFLPFIGISTGICVFLASGLIIFGFPVWLSYGLAVPMTLGTGWLLWTQLGQNLSQLERGGSQALDLDSWG